MITIFNRKELISTYEMKKQGEIRALLDAEGIDYSVRVINRNSPSPFAAGSRARTGTYGEKLELEYEYTIFVRRRDYENARFVLHGMESGRNSRS